MGMTFTATYDTDNLCPVCPELSTKPFCPHCGFLARKQWHCLHYAEKKPKLEERVPIHRVSCQELGVTISLVA